MHNFEKAVKYGIESSTITNVKYEEVHNLFLKKCA